MRPLSPDGQRGLTSYNICINIYIYIYTHTHTHIIYVHVYKYTHIHVFARRRKGSGVHETLFVDHDDVHGYNSARLEPVDHEMCIATIAQG